MTNEPDDQPIPGLPTPFNSPSHVKANHPPVPDDQPTAEQPDKQRVNICWGCGKGFVYDDPGDYFCPACRPNQPTAGKPHLFSDRYIKQTRQAFQSGTQETLFMDQLISTIRYYQEECSRLKQELNAAEGCHESKTDECIRLEKQLCKSKIEWERELERNHEAYKENVRLRKELEEQRAVISGMQAQNYEIAKELWKMTEECDRLKEGLEEKKNQPAAAPHTGCTWNHCDKTSSISTSCEKYFQFNRLFNTFQVCPYCKLPVHLQFNENGKANE